MSNGKMICDECTGSDLVGHEGTCQLTWANDAWAARELVWSHRAESWVWRTLPKVVKEKSTYRRLEVQEVPDEETPDFATQEELAELLG